MFARLAPKPVQRTLFPMTGTSLLTLASVDEPTIDLASSGFIVSAAMVLLMTTGVSPFYGGMSRAKSVLNMMMMSFRAFGLVGILYVLYGYSMSFGRVILGHHMESFQVRPVRHLRAGQPVRVRRAAAPSPNSPRRLPS